MRHRVIHLINPKADSLTTRPLYLNRALYSPLAGLLAVAAAIPRDRYEVVLTDENIESIDFDVQADLADRGLQDGGVRLLLEDGERLQDRNPGVDQRRELARGL